MTDTRRSEIEPYVAEATPVGDLLVRAAGRTPDEEAVVFPDARMTFAELAGLARGAADRLLALGVEPREHVGLLLPNAPETLAWLLGTALVGAAAVPINARFKAAELGYVIDDAELVTLVTTDRVSEYADFPGLLQQAFPDLAAARDPHALDLAAATRLRQIVLLGTTSPAGMIPESALASGPPSVDALREIERRRTGVRLGDTAIMMYTSGTTADPKGCPLTHEMLSRTAHAMAHERYRLTAADRFWDPLPMFHMSSILPFLACLDVGATFLPMRHFEAHEALAQLEGERATVAFPSFPALMLDLIQHPDFPARDLSALRIVNNVAPPEMLERMQAALPRAIQISAYGLTEATGVIAWNELTETAAQRTTSCGPPLPGIEVRIVDPDTRELLPPGAQGEMAIRGYCVFEGYWNAPEKNAEVFDDAGWFHTGDLCAITEDGRIQFHGRLKDMLKVGGENVAALEIESFLAGHPAVALAQVVGVPDERLVEVPAAFVELRPGVAATEEELIAYCRGRLSSFKIPRIVRFVEEWPMSATKVQKFRLREALLGG